MAQHAQALASFGTSSGNGRLAAFSAMFAERFSGRAERARIRRELDSYSDRQLNDLGLSRYDIEDVARGRYVG